MRLIPVAILALCFSLGTATSASALSIVGQFNSSVLGPDSDPLRGGGNLVSIFEAAAGFWETAILDDAVVTISFGWYPLPGPLGFAFGADRAGSVFFPLNNPWFVDSTPTLNEEFTSTQHVSATLNGRTINYANGLTGGMGAAGGYDLFSVMLHEIGHVLSFGPNFLADQSDGFVNVTAPRPMAGIALPVAGTCCHLDTPPGYTGFTPLMYPFMGPGERRLISGADLLFVAEGGGWQNVDPTRLAPVPEPGTLTLVALGAVALRLRKRQRRPHLRRPSSE